MLVELSDVTKQLVAPVQWLPGTVTAGSETNLAAEIEGSVAWLVEEGTQVAKGDVVARLDANRLKIRLREDEANLQRNVANLEYLTTKLARLEKLKVTNSASQENLDETKMLQQVARQDTKVAEATLALTKYELSKTELHAPFDAIALSHLSNIGEYAGTGTAIIKLVESTRLEVRVATPITAANYLNEGMHLATEYQGLQLRLPISKIIPVGNARSQTFDLRLNASNAALMIGSAVKVGIPRQDEREVLVVQRDSLILRNREVFLFKVGADMKAKRISVNVGEGFGDLVEVSGDIHLGDRVVIKGGETLRDGQLVKTPGLS